METVVYYYNIILSEIGTFITMGYRSKIAVIKKKLVIMVRVKMHKQTLLKQSKPSSLHGAHSHAIFESKLLNAMANACSAHMGNW